MSIVQDPLVWAEPQEGPPLSDEELRNVVRVLMTLQGALPPLFIAALGVLVPRALQKARRSYLRFGNRRGTLQALIADLGLALRLLAWVSLLFAMGCTVTALYPLLYVSESFSSLQLVLNFQIGAYLVQSLLFFMIYLWYSWKLGL